MRATRSIRIGLALLGLTACTSQNWYEGMKASKRNECLRLPVSEQAACLQEIEPDYRVYQRQRSGGD